MKLKQFYVSLFTCLLAMFCLVAFSGNAMAKKDIVVAHNEVLPTMDPHDCSNNNAYSIQRAIFEGLYGFGKGMKMVPVLAKSYTTNAAATEFTFKLREGIYFHDGVPS